MPTLKEAICMVKEAWNKVTRRTIANCWRRAGNNHLYLLLFILYNI